MSNGVEPGEVKLALPEGDDRPADQEELTTLSQLTREFAFFTPALILTHGHFDRDPMREFNAFRPVDTDAERPFAVDAARPFFQGLGVHPLPDGEMVNWDHRLYGIVRHRWDEVLNFLGGLAMYDSRRYHYARAMSYSLLIVDPTSLGQGGPVLWTGDVPTISITVFGVSTNRGIHYLAPAADPPRTRPFPHTRPADQKLVAEAEAVLGPPPDPSQLAQRIYPEANHEG